MSTTSGQEQKKSSVYLRGYTYGFFYSCPSFQHITAPLVTKINFKRSLLNFMEVQKFIGQKLGYSFRDLDLLERALTHSSAGINSAVNNYERLEFLGDAVLDLCVAHILSEKYADAAEGHLTKMRSALVNAKTLAEIATEMSLGQFLILSPAEESAGGREKPSILADIIESLIGAIYLESGYDVAFSVIREIFEKKVAVVSITDPKTDLQELIHSQGNKSSPEYILEDIEGPDHAPKFVFTVRVNDVNLGEGSGNTKKEAQQNAALMAIKRLKGIS